MNFDDFYGLGALAKRLRAEVNDGRGVHAYLFVGPRGTGKKSMADICARALNCAGAQKPCDACPSCLRFLAGTHPDVIRVTKQGPSIPVDEVRRLIAKVAVKPFEGGKHVVLIEDADGMTQQAQNALLKTLETPPTSAVIFLIAESASALLETILSRCRTVRFHGLDQDTCQKALIRQGLEPDRAVLLSELSGGSVGVAMALNGDKDYWALRERVLKTLGSVRGQGDIPAATTALKDDKDSAERVLTIMEHAALGLIRRDEGHKPSADQGTLKQIKIPGDRLLLGVLRARERQASNVVWLNVLETLFFDMVGG